MTREEVLNSRRWKVSYTYDCDCGSPCYCSNDGRNKNWTYLNNGEQELGAQAAAEKVARLFRHTGIGDARIRQESEAERDRRLEWMRQQEADEQRGIHWAMGGAN
ncbi:hypothetical protein [Streptomyces sp. NPDC049555]|uniref:hypothetical protein n=1 Tax=Streptomyces sp. NPDC049555 TaxID=3154930 RepID=UPI0034316D7F